MVAARARSTARACCCRAPTSAAKSSPTSCAPPARSSPTSSPTGPCWRTPTAKAIPDVYGMLLEGRIDVVTFTSASAVRNFAKVYGARPGGGPAEEHRRRRRSARSTADAAAQLGIHVDHSADDATPMPGTGRRDRRALSNRGRLAHGAAATRCCHDQPRAFLDLWFTTRPGLVNRGSARGKIRLWQSRPPPAWPCRVVRGGCAAPRRSARLVRETRLTPDCFIYPLFVCEGEACGARSARCRACISCRWTRR